jgi:hypothetical protein
MIAFTIQQLLVLLDNSSRGGGASHESSLSGTISGNSGPYDKMSSEVQRKMSQWLTEKLSEADVLDVIEPYWFSEFSEVRLQA